MSVLRSIRWPYAVIAVIAVAVASVGLLRPQLAAVVTGSPGATALIGQNPPPTLFTDAAVAPLGRRVAAQRTQADTLFAQWKNQHGTTQDDKAFAAWAAQQIPAPPTATARTAELHKVQDLAKTRTAAGKKAATWLELYGKQDIWKLYQHDQRELVPAAKGTDEKARLKSALKLAKTISDQLAARDKQPAPFVLDPSLRPDKHITPGAKGPYSYPSRHAARSAAAVTLLSAFAPHRTEDYRWMQDEVVYSRVYMAGHVPSDILAGTLLGDLIGDYELSIKGN
ncbi:phosphatase PAP2 family protein [Streptomyces sp. NPDC005251]|uniref:phosphatase PAP2 family protein n=1 Tax=unclassified Streptomyces TaxID=2593676 RepID=UPI0033B6B012